MNIDATGPAIVWVGLLWPVLVAAEFPDTGSPHKFGTRRVFPKKFPFSVVYPVRESEVYVLALAPFRRKPNYWSARRLDVWL